MYATIAIERPSTSGDDTDDDGYPIEAMRIVWQGPGSIRYSSTPEARANELAGATIVSMRPVVRLPYDTPVHPGDRIRVVNDPTNPTRNGVTMTVLGTDAQSQSTQLRVQCTEIQNGHP